MTNGFDLITDKAVFKCQKSEASVNREKMTRWWIKALLKPEDIKADFTLPEN